MIYAFEQYELDVPRYELRYAGKLVKLEFPKTEIQVYGNTVLVYTTYLYEIDMKGKRTTASGRATEMFLRRGDELVNVGWHMDSGN